jgi:chromate transport protein ChrA
MTSNIGLAFRHTTADMASVLAYAALLLAALQGISPAVIGITAVALLQMLPHAIPDLLTAALAVGTVLAMELWGLSPLPLMAGGSAMGLVLRAR